jgi:outer membrane protein OmpA-like peptidoglycan-associated protein
MRTLLMLGAMLAISGCTDLGMDGGVPVQPTPATPVFFQPFSAALDQPALATIATAAKIANQEPDARVVVIGAADSVGSAAANKYLSKTRAQVVADQLVSDGVDASRIHTHGAGEVGGPANTAQASRRALIEIGG